MKELIDLIQNYGSTTILAVLCIKLYISLNAERKNLMETLDKRTQTYTDSINTLVGNLDRIVERLDRIEDKLK